MSDPSQYGTGNGENVPPPGDHYPPYPPPPPQGQYPPPPGQYPPPYGDSAAPYGRDPISGEPLSDKSKVIAGLLQLLGLFYVLGIGRIYMGQVSLGVVQLVVCLLVTPVVGFLTCGVGFVIPFIWTIVDVVILFAGKPRDQHGRLLRNGT